MSISRIASLLIKNIRLTFRGLDPAIDFFYWPLYDLLIWGFASKAAVAQGGSPAHTASLITGLILWQAVYRGNLDVSFSLLQEMWSRNIVNIFSTPVKIGEWLVSVILLAAINALIATAFGMIAVWFLYGIWVFSIGWLYAFFFIFLLSSGVAIGLCTASALIIWGPQAQKLVWVMGYFFIPFSGIFYVLETLPYACQLLAAALPMSYFFTALRLYMLTYQIDWSLMSIGMILTIVYLFGAYIIFRYSFAFSKKWGLARLQQ